MEGGCRGHSSTKWFMFGAQLRYYCDLKIVVLGIDFCICDSTLLQGLLEQESNYLYNIKYWLDNCIF